MSPDQFAEGCALTGAGPCKLLIQARVRVDSRSLQQ